MTCIYCNDDPQVKPNCYCRPIGDNPFKWSLAFFETAKASRMTVIFAWLFGERVTGQDDRNSFVGYRYKGRLYLAEVTPHPIKWVGAVDERANEAFHQLKHETDPVKRRMIRARLNSFYGASWRDNGLRKVIYETAPRKWWAFWRPKTTVVVRDAPPEHVNCRCVVK